MKNRPHAVIIAIILLAVVPLMVAGAFVAVIGLGGHERIIERELAELTGVEVGITGLCTLDVNTFTVDRLRIGGDLFDGRAVEFRCLFDPFVLDHVRIGSCTVDLAGGNMGRLQHLVDQVRRSPGAGGAGFRARVESAAVRIPRDWYEGVFDIRLDGVDITGTVGLITARAERLALKDAATGVAVEFVYNPPDRSAKATVTGSLAVFNSFLPRGIAFGDLPVRTTCTLAPSADGTALEYTAGVVRAAGGGALVEGQGRIMRNGTWIVVDVFQADLDACLAAVTTPLWDFVTCGGGRVTGRGAVERGTEYRFRLLADIARPRLAFRRDVVTGGTRLSLTRLDAFAAEGILIDGEAVAAPTADGGMVVKVGGLRGRLQPEGAFWNADGSVDFKAGGPVRSDINVSVYEVPAEALHGVFRVYDSSDAWIERMTGPIDLRLEHFNLADPRAVPLVFSSGSRGLAFWINQSRPRIDGIFFNELKLFLKPAEAP
ncbi:MAG: hypothetical protein ABIF71_02960 [Planctomycetota bacterium]